MLKTAGDRVFVHFIGYRKVFDDWVNSADVKLYELVSTYDLNTLLQ